MHRARVIARSTLARFLVAGGVGYAVNQACLVALYEYLLVSIPRASATPLGAFNPSLLLASLIAAEVSILVRFALNDLWTFSGQRHKPLWERVYQSNLTSFGSPLIALACVNVLTPQLGLSYLVANSLGILLGLGWNWYWSSQVVWRNAESTGALGQTRVVRP